MADLQQSFSKFTSKTSESITPLVVVTICIYFLLYPAAEIIEHNKSSVHTGNTFMEMGSAVSQTFAHTPTEATGTSWISRPSPAGRKPGTKNESSWIHLLRIPRHRVSAYGEVEGQTCPSVLEAGRLDLLLFPWLRTPTRCCFHEDNWEINACVDHTML